MLKKVLQTGMILLLLFVIVSAAAGCGDFADFLMTAGGPNALNTETPRDSVQLIYNVHKETYVDEKDGTPILELSFVYPQVKNTNGDQSIDAINQHFYDEMKAYLAVVEADGVSYAAADKQASVKGEYGFSKHVYSMMPHVSYNGNGFLSIVYEKYENTGGARPNVTRTADNFELRTGNRITLTDLLGRNAEKTVYSIVRRAIRMTENTKAFVYYKSYYDDAEALYSPEDFYLAEKSLVFFYQTDTIAPYAAGVSSFNISLNDMRMRKNIPDAPSVEALDKAYAATCLLLDDSEGYYVNPKNYSFEITDFTGTAATLTVYSQNEPSDGSGGVTITARMVQENSVWKLNK